MRLGQLSRKLGIHTSKIIDFLASKDIVINEDSNTRIEDEYVTWITQKYAPQLMAEVSNTLSEEKIEPIIHIPGVEEVTPAEEKPMASETSPLPELIKAPKIELSGLKVLGKIEIPEKKKPATTQEQSEPTISDTTSVTERKKNPRKDFTPRPQKNPVALQREREERETERKRKEKLQREKEKKTYNYLSRVKTQAPTKKSQYVKEQIEETASITEEVPKSLWGKFLRWLRT
ncbi:MAG: hypothetical protein HOP37_06965 [Cyclobacteriaceae bacterium]|nr:hypothetical protein [Cyclobacteriaceae bacterium]